MLPKNKWMAGPYRLWEFTHLVPCDARGEAPHSAGDRDKSLYLDDKGVPVSGQQYVDAGLHTLLPLRRPALARPVVHLCPRHGARLRRAQREAARGRVWPFGENKKKALAWGLGAAAVAGAGALAYRHFTEEPAACAGKATQRECPTDGGECAWHGNQCLGAAQLRWRAAHTPWFQGDRAMACAAAGGQWTPGAVYGGTCTPKDETSGALVAVQGQAAGAAGAMGKTVRDMVQGFRAQGNGARVDLTQWINMEHARRLALDRPPKLLRTTQLPLALVTHDGDQVALTYLGDQRWFAGALDDRGRPRGDGVLWQKETDGALDVRYARFDGGRPVRLHRRWRRQPADGDSSWTVGGPATDCLARLGLRAADARDEEKVRRAFREKSREVHPDKGGSDQAMMELTACFNVLKPHAA